mmetsp:Transcript_44773/g.52481  ORF Transcript_44773/g.52481 Transcript_44773/m.52481 type:complete len:532 (+) Transcript_44773:212-1807(+)
MGFFYYFNTVTMILSFVISSSVPSRSVLSHNYSPFPPNPISNCEQLLVILGNTGIDKEFFPDFLPVVVDSEDSKTNFYEICHLCSVELFKDKKRKSVAQFDSHFPQAMYNVPSCTADDQMIEMSNKLMFRVKDLICSSDKSNDNNVTYINNGQKSNTRSYAVWTDEAEYIRKTLRGGDCSISVRKVKNGRKGDGVLEGVAYMHHVIFDSNGREYVKSSTASLLQQEKQFSSQYKILGLDEIQYDPTYVSADEFIDAIEMAALNHTAVKHPFLDSLENGSYGEERTIEIVAHYLMSYKHFTKDFSKYLGRCEEMCSATDPEFGEILHENLLEENGVYDEETLDELIEMGINVTEVNGVTHKDLFDLCTQNLIHITGGVKAIPIERQKWIVSPLNKAFEDACISQSSSTAATSIAALYFGSELIVNTIYSKLSNYLRTVSSVISIQDIAFFHMHMGMDIKHAQKMREIAVAHAGDKKSRKAVALVVDAILSARVDVYDRMTDEIARQQNVDTDNLCNVQSENCASAQSRISCF